MSGCAPAGSGSAGRPAGNPDRASRAAEPFDGPAPTLEFGRGSVPAAAAERGTFARGPDCSAAFDAREDDLDSFEPDDPLVSAAAVGGIDTTAVPIPSATARAPTRPAEATFGEIMVLNLPKSHLLQKKYDTSEYLSRTPLPAHMSKCVGSLSEFVAPTAEVHCTSCPVNHPYRPRDGRAFYGTR